MKLNVKAKLKEDGTIWDITAICFDERITVIVKPTEEFESYYRCKYSSGSEFPEPIENEYDLEEVEIILSLQ